ncbi:hypothetical protein GA0061093_1574 [Rhodococcus qingshengii]|nr:hypothetical protein GA0061093_1574 [Rhodococcus qingshengii]
MRRIASPVRSVRVSFEPVVTVYPSLKIRYRIRITVEGRPEKSSFTVNSNRAPLFWICCFARLIRTAMVCSVTP